MELYNAKDAATELDAISKARIDSPYTGLQFSEISKEANWMSTFKPVYGGAPVLWRLSQTIEGQAYPEEVVATIQGIVSSKDLPPFTCKISGNGRHARYLRQSISLIGFGSTYFQEAITQIAGIHSLFDRYIGSNKLEPCLIVGEYQGQPSLSLSNRYFMPQSDALGAADIPFSEDIDPHGYLRNAAGTNFLHCEDNMVRYYERTVCTTTGEQRFVPTSPVKFQVGDIVEVQVSFVAVPIKDRKFKSTLVIRTLTLMEGKFTQEANTARILKNPVQSANKPVSILKRRIGYGEEELASTRAKLGRMDIDSDTAQAAASSSNAANLD